MEGASSAFAGYERADEVSSVSLFVVHYLHAHILLDRSLRIATETLQEGEERLQIVNTRRAQLDRQLGELHRSKRQCDVGDGF